MPHIRALSRSDLPAVADLMQEHMPGPAADEDFEAFLTRRSLDSPWADPELPSLVATDDSDRVVGSITSEVRRMRWRGKEIRGVCCAHLVVSPESRGGATGTLLMGALLKAGQDVTWSESASNDVVRIWDVYGGSLDAARSCDWMLVLRPGAWIRSIGGAAARRSLEREALPVGAFPLHAAARGRMKGRIPDPGPGISAEAADAGTIAAETKAMARGLKLFVDHDEAYLDSVFREIESVRGRLVVRLVRRNGRAIGWYAYLPGGSGPSQTLHISAARGEAVAVFDDLVRHAEAEGATALAGRMDPHLVAALRPRVAVLGFARQPVVHASDPELRADLATPGALITRLDGEWFTA